MSPSVASVILELLGRHGVSRAFGIPACATYRSGTPTRRPVRGSSASDTSRQRGMRPTACSGPGRPGAALLTSGAGSGEHPRRLRRGLRQRLGRSRHRQRGERAAFAGREPLVHLAGDGDDGGAVRLTPARSVGRSPGCRSLAGGPSAAVLGRGNADDARSRPCVRSPERSVRARDPEGPRRARPNPTPARSKARGSARPRALGGRVDMPRSRGEAPGIHTYTARATDRRGRPGAGSISSRSSPRAGGGGVTGCARRAAVRGSSAMSRRAPTPKRPAPVSARF